MQDHEQVLGDKYIVPENLYTSDEVFDQLYPASVQTHSKRHWTPLAVAERAASFLAADGACRILDIGSGVGKFCLAAAYYMPQAHFFGIEQRKSLVDYARSVGDVLQLRNASFAAGNFTQLDFRGYDHFYFYNSFYENLEGTQKIDNDIDYSEGLYNYYNRYLYRQLDRKPAGTKLVTFHSMEDEVPPGYLQVGETTEHLLKYWIKI